MNVNVGHFDVPLLILNVFVTFDNVFFFIKEVAYPQTIGLLSDGSRLSAAAEWLEWEARGGAGVNAAAGAEVKRVVGVETLLLALRPHTNYTIQALAYTAAGDGVPADPVHCSTQQDGKFLSYMHCGNVWEIPETICFLNRKRCHH